MIKKGRFLCYLRNRPDYSALFSTRPNNPYAERGIRGISTRETGNVKSASRFTFHASRFPHLSAGDAELVHQFQFAPEFGAGDFAPQQPAVL